MLRLLVQFGGARFHPGHVSLLAPAAVLALSACVAVLTLPLLERAIPRLRRRLRARRARRRRAHLAVNAERRTRALMDELCPYGWQAQITLSRPGVVTLDWTELRGEDRRAAVVRRVRAESIPEVLDAMVADRRTDETLEQIEQIALAEGTAWPER